MYTYLRQIVQLKENFNNKIKTFKIHNDDLGVLIGEDSDLDFETIPINQSDITLFFDLKADYFLKSVQEFFEEILIQDTELTNRNSNRNSTRHFSFENIDK